MCTIPFSIAIVAEGIKLENHSPVVFMPFGLTMDTFQCLVCLLFFFCSPPCVQWQFPVEWVLLSSVGLLQ